MKRTSRIFTEEISENFYLMRIDDKETLFFESLWYIPEGITYNAYLMLTDGGNILFDAWKHAYSEQFIETLKNIVDARDIDYIVIHHTEPDHSGSLPKLLEENGFKAEIIGNPLSKTMLENFYNIKLKFKPVKDGDSMIIGGKKLVFIHTPWLHWPETMMTYIPEDKILLSGDAFGGFSTPNAIHDSDEQLVSEYIPFARKYFATIIGHYRPHVLKAIDKVAKLGIGIELIAPLHGILWRRDPNKIIEYYVKWAKAEPEKGKVIVIYSSMYGSCEEAVKVAVDELSRLGYNPIIFKFTDREQDPLSDVLGELIDAEAIILASATYEAGIFPTISHLLNIVSHKLRSNKHVLILSSYGWGGVAGRKMSETLSNAGFNIVDTIEFRGRLSKEDRERIVESVRKLIEQLSS